MKLNDFIKNALLDIVKGVDAANHEKNRFRLTSHVHANGESGQKVEFDVTIIVNETSESETNGGLKVAIVNLNGGKKEMESSQNAHKIKFDVFITEK